MIESLIKRKRSSRRISLEEVHGSRTRGFTLIELLITITVIAVLAGIVTFAATTLQKNTRDAARDAKVQILANALEKYYRDNGEYPSVAAMTSSNVDALKKKLKIPDTDTFKLPGATAANSVAVSGASPSTLVYSANTTDSTKNAQCQTVPDGYCDGYTLAYVKESTGQSATVQSLHATFTAVKDSSTCNEGDTQNGTTCTHTYNGTYNAATYTCPSGYSQSGSNCTTTYGASYSSGGSYYYCPNGGYVDNSTCVVNTWYNATFVNYYYYCTSGTLSGQYCDTVSYFPATHYGGNVYSCPAGSTPWYPQCRVYTHTPATRVDSHYTCPSGGALDGYNICKKTTTYGASLGSTSGYYYCSGSDALSGSTCTKSVAASSTPAYYTCPNGGTPTGSTCSYTYELQG